MSLVGKLCLQLLQGLLGVAKLVCDAGQVGCMLIMPASTCEHAYYEQLMQLGVSIVRLCQVCSSAQDVEDEHSFFV